MKATQRSNDPKPSSIIRARRPSKLEPAVNRSFALVAPDRRPRRFDTSTGFRLEALTYCT
jgi:hypothetical protein